MLKKIWIILISGIIMLLCAPLSLTAFAADVRLYDEGAKLSESEYNECLNRIQQAANQTGMNVGVVMGTTPRTDLEIESLADSTYDQLFGKNTDGILMYMDLKGNKPYHFISTSGMGNFYYTNSKADNRIDVIFDLMEAYLYPIGNEDVYGAVMLFADEVEYFYQQGVPDSYYYYDDVFRKYYYLDASGEILSSSRKPYTDWLMVMFFAFIGFGMGMITALIVFLCVRSHYQFKHSLSPTTYVNHRHVQFIRQYDNFVRTYTNKVRIDHDSHSGGGSHSGGASRHSHGGGGSSHGGHGGGGRHF